MASENSGKITMSERMAGLKSEFGKIVWADRKKVTKQTIATIISSVVIALLIVIFDMLIQYGVDYLVKIGG